MRTCVSSRGAKNVSPSKPGASAKMPLVCRMRALGRIDALLLGRRRFKNVGAQFVAETELMLTRDSFAVWPHCDGGSTYAECISKCLLSPIRRHGLLFKNAHIGALSVC